MVKCYGRLNLIHVMVIKILKLGKLIMISNQVKQNKAKNTQELRDNVIFPTQKKDESY
jgi:hypothetical protein